ncbi:permease [Cohnella lubricantis]|nr:permease [Cohnella lubricantis]MBP2120050.1 uncharacterized membrane protein YraQ (UPF0718 family) [Cohnella lubricantis]
MAAIFLLITIAGLTYVKWWPYYDKALAAIEKHTIGSSMIPSAKPDASSSIWQASWEYSVAYFNSVWKAALLGMIVGAMVQVLLPANWLKRAMGKMSFKSTLVGGVTSLPGMMCTCCAAPIASSMRKQQVSIGAALAFWLGNPTLNPATLIFMTFVLSWKFTALRIFFGLVLTFGISYLANRFADRKRLEELPLTADTEPSEAADRGPFLWRWAKSFAGMFIRIVPTYLITVYVIGLLQAVLDPSWVSNSVIAILVCAVIGTLFVIPTAAEIPIVQSFLAFGTGPASALLLTLPSVSLPSLLLVSRAFPRKVLLFVAGSVIVLGVLCGITGSLWL